MASTQYQSDVPQRMTWGVVLRFVPVSQRRRAERAQQRKWQSDRQRYGKTEGGKYVDQTSLEQLMSLGYELPLVAEALRQVRRVGAGGGGAHMSQQDRLMYLHTCGSLFLARQAKAMPGAAMSHMPE